MREIKFRGKTETTGKRWIFGNLFIEYENATGKPQCYIMTGFHHTKIKRVIPETVGQYVWMDDDAKEIYDGDVVECWNDGDELELKKRIVVGNYCSEFSGYGFCRKIGNVHDNPELLKGGKNEQ